MVEAAVNVPKLRAQIAATMHTPPWIVYPSTDPMGRGVGAHGTKYNIGGFEFDDDNALAVAAVNALPALLDVYEAACAWRDDRAQMASALLTCDRGAEDRLIAAINVARGAK